MKEILKKDEEVKNSQLKAAIKQANGLDMGLAIFIISFGIVGGTIFVKGISNGITRPIEKMKAAMKEIANGDLTKDVKIDKGSEEIIQMAVEFNKVLKGLKDIIRNTVDSSYHVSVCSGFGRKELQPDSSVSPAGGCCD